MKIESSFINTDDEVGLVERVHNDTLSDDEVKACIARCFKEVMPVIGRWMESERARRTPVMTMLSAGQNVSVSILGTVIVNVIPPHLVPSVVDALAPLIVEQLKTGLAQAKDET